VRGILRAVAHTAPLVTGVDFVGIPVQDFDATLAIMRAEDFGGTFSRNADATPPQTRLPPRPSYS
jgi:hypothetical protein